jgi:hypothetical protein
MNTNIQDIYYNKYIKYKTKYLELKELNGSGIFYKSKKDLYGYYYDDLNNCLIKTKVIDQITKTININYIKEIIKKPINTLLENIDNKDIINIIKKAKLIKIVDIIGVLNEIEYVLLIKILPELYVKFEEKLIAIEKKIKIKDTTEAEQLKAEIEADIEAETQLKVKVNIKKDKYKKNIDSIINVYNCLCNTIQAYNDYYLNKNFIITEKLEINKKNDIKKQELLDNLNKIEPKVSWLLEAINFYFDFLKYYIINNIEPYINNNIESNATNNIEPNATNNIEPFKSNICTYYKNYFIFYIGSKTNNPKDKIINKVYENYFYDANTDTDVKTQELLNKFYKDIINFSSNDIKEMKDRLVIILEKIRDNIIILRKTSKKNNNSDGFKKLFNEDNDKNPFNKIIKYIHNNYNEIDINKSIKWENYYEKYQNEIDVYLINYINYNSLLLKKCINIYLYKMFNNILQK